MATFIFTCPFCNQELDCDYSLIGVTVNCPKCGKEIIPVRPHSAGAPEQPATIDMPTEDDAKSPSESLVSRILNVFSKAFNSAAAGVRASEKHIDDIDDEPFRVPLLASIARGEGLFWIAAAVFCLALPMLDYGIKPLPAVVMALVCASFAIIPFGIAQFITYIGKTSYNSDRIVELLKELKDKR